MAIYCRVKEFDILPDFHGGVISRQLPRAKCATPTCPSPPGPARAGPASTVYIISVRSWAGIGAAP